jgi:hypothetical protein
VLRLIAASRSFHADRLPGGPEASVGLLVHRVLERWARGHSADPLELFDLEYTQLRKELGDDSARRHFADLAATKGLQAWTRLRSWVGERCRHLEQRLPKKNGAVVGAGAPRGVPVGPERHLASDRLRLGGQADRIRSLGASAYEVRDFKSGNVVGDDGEVKPAIQLQLRAYGLMILDVDPRASVRLVVDDGDEHDVGFDATAQLQAREEIQNIVARVPLAGVADAAGLATAGPSCHGCSIRHVCSAYREAAPGWWRSFPPTIERLPDDIWGTVVEVLPKPGATTVDVVLIDAAGRHVRVDGVDVRHDALAVPARSRVWLFGLQASARPRGYDGKRFHPRVFHELPRDGHERRAWSAVVLLEG